MPKGKFIVFSGGEGSGKSTILRMLEEEFPHIVLTREPGGTPTGKRIREILLDDANLDPDVMTELHLFMADRWEHVQRVILPNMIAGETVISDRHWMDTFAYQWFATMHESRVQDFLDRFVDQSWPRPDAWLWFSVNPSTGLARKQSTDEQNRLDVRSAEFHSAVHDGFLMLFNGYEGRKFRIDANQPLERVYTDVKAALQPFLQP